MNQKTDTFPPASPKPEFEIAPWKVRWLVLLTIGTLLLGLEMPGKRGIFRWGPYASFPNSNLPMIAAGTTIANAISEFSGSSIPPLSSYYYGTFIMLVLAWIIAPTLFFFCWRFFTKEKINGVIPRKSLKISATLGFVLGGSLVAVLLMGSIPGVIVQRITYHNMHTGQALQSHKDSLLSCLRMACFDAYQYKILPMEIGGGGNSYVGYQLGDNMLIKEMSRDAAVSIKDISPDKIGFGIRSKIYPSSAVTVYIDSVGQMLAPVYEGDFL